MPSPSPQTVKALGAAYRLLAYRPRTHAELRQRLERRFPQEVVEEVLNTLQDDGLLDDAAFAQAFVRSRTAQRPRSGALLRSELQGHGVSREVAEAAVAGLDEEALAAQAAARALKRLTRASASPPDVRRRLWSYLRRRGFSGETIRHTVERALRESVPTRGLSLQD